MFLVFSYCIYSTEGQSNITAIQIVVEVQHSILTVKELKFKKLLIRDTKCVVLTLFFIQIISTKRHTHLESISYDSFVNNENNRQKFTKEKSTFCSYLVETVFGIISVQSPNELIIIFRVTILIKFLILNLVFEISNLTFVI